MYFRFYVKGYSAGKDYIVKTQAFQIKYAEPSIECKIINDSQVYWHTPPLIPTWGVEAGGSL